MSLDLLADQFSYQGFAAGKRGDPGVTLYIRGDDGVTGLASPPRDAQLADRQGHGRVGGSQWAKERTVTSTVWTDDLATLLAFDATMAPRPDPLDEVPWTGRFLGLGERRIYVRPNEPDWKIDQTGNAANIWVAKLSWTATDPTIFSEDELTTAWSAASSTDLTFANGGSSQSSSGRAWEATLTASGTVHDPYIESLDDTAQSIRFTGLTLTTGQSVVIHADRTCTIGALHVEGLIRTRGEKFPNWPTQKPGTNHWRVGTAVSGNVSGEVRSRSTWSV